MTNRGVHVDVELFPNSLMPDMHAIVGGNWLIYMNEAHMKSNRVYKLEKYV